MADNPNHWPRKWTGADMRCPKCNKYLPDRCTCNGPSIEEQRSMTTNTRTPATGAAGTDKGQDQMHQDKCNAALRAAPASEHDSLVWVLTGLDAVQRDIATYLRTGDKSVLEAANTMALATMEDAYAASRFRAQGGNTKPSSVPSPATGGEPAKDSAEMEVLREALEQARYALRKAPDLYSCGYNELHAESCPNGTDSTGATKNDYVKASGEILAAIYKARDIVRQALAAQVPAPVARELDVEAERRAFEAYARSKGLPVDKYEWGEYLLGETQSAWGIWQASRRAATGTPAKNQ